MPAAIGSPPMYAPIAFPRLKDICEHEAPKISPPFAFLINRSCCGADTPNRQPVQMHIKIIETIGFEAKKKIKTSAMKAVSCVIPATNDGAYLSDNFPPIKFPAHMPAPANIIRGDTNFAGMCEKFTKSGLM